MHTPQTDVALDTCFLISTLSQYRRTDINTHRTYSLTFSPKHTILKQDDYYRSLSNKLDKQYKL